MKKKETKFTLRIESKIVSEVDKLIFKRIGISRNTWILEAIYEKLKREKNE